MDIRIGLFSSTPDWDDLEIRHLDLKGKTETVSVRVLATDRAIVG